MKSVSAYEAKTHLPTLLNAVTQGEKITITPKGMPIAIRIPDQKAKASVNDTLKALLEFRKGQTLKDVSIQEMKEEGRRY